MNSEENTSQPDAETQRIDAETQRLDETQRIDDAPAAPAAAEAPRTGRTRRLLLIGAAAAVALVAVGGGAYAIGTNVGDDDDRPAAQGPDDGQRPGAGDRDDSRRGDDDRADRDDDHGSGRGEAGARPVADAASMRAAAEAAITEAGGTGASAIDVEHSGYEVEVILADGREVDVYVAPDGTAIVEPERDDDRRAEPALDLAALDRIIDAALAASSSAAGVDGAIDSVSTSDDQGVAFEVSVLLSDGRDADIDLAADLALVTADVDD